MEGAEIPQPPPDLDIKPKFSMKETLAPSSLRGIDFYLNHSQLDPKSLDGKQIVNLGAGGDDLGQELKLLGVESKVVNIDLKYPRTIFGQKEINGTKLTPNDAVRANMLRLPLATNSMDVVFASDSLTRWVGKDRQPIGFNEAVRVLAPEGKMYAFEFDWQSIKPTEVFTSIKSEYPNSQFEYDDKRKTLRITKAESFQAFGENVPTDPEKIFNSISNEPLKKDLLSLLALASENVDENGSSRAKVMSFIEQHLKDDVRKIAYPDVENGDWEKFDHIVATCVDAGNEFGNNSAFQRARKLVLETTLIQPEKFASKISPELLKIAQNLDPDKAATLDKIRAFDKAITTDTWFSLNKNEINWLRENDPQGWRFAIFTLRKNAITLTDQEKQQSLSYFEDILSRTKQGDPNAKKTMDIFRILGSDYKTDEVWSNFTKYHDPSVYGVAEYWSSSAFVGPIETIKRASIKEMNLQGKIITVNDRSNGNPEEYVNAIIKILKIPQNELRNKIVYEQTIRLNQCPSCYGYEGGFRTQKLLQETLNDESLNIQYDQKRVEFASKIRQLLKNNGYLKMQI